MQKSSKRRMQKNRPKSGSPKTQEEQQKHPAKKWTQTQNKTNTRCRAYFTTFSCLVVRKTKRRSPHRKDTSGTLLPFLFSFRFCVKEGVLQSCYFFVWVSSHFWHVLSGLVARKNGYWGNRLQARAVVRSPKVLRSHKQYNRPHSLKKIEKAQQGDATKRVL
jgi:hypothetical protein